MRRSVLALISLLLLEVGVHAATRNLVPNSSCESGAKPGALPEGWHIWMENPGSAEAGSDMTLARFGSCSLKVANPGKGGANVTTGSIPCEPNTQYVLSVYVRTQDAVSTLTMGAKDAEGKVITWGLDGGQVVPGTTDWVRIVHVVTTPANCVYLVPHLTNRGGTIWWDACQLELGAEATVYVDSEPPELPEIPRPAPGENAAPTPDFEQDPAVTGWETMTHSGDETGKATWDSTEAHSGTHSLKIESVTKTRRWQSPFIAIDPASTYRLSAWLRTVALEGRADVFLECYGRWLTPAGRAGYDGGVYAYEDCPWTERYAVIAPTAFPETAKYARIVCEVTGTVHGTGEAWFDDLSLVMAPATLDVQPRETGERYASSIFQPGETVPYELTVHVPGAAKGALDARFTVTDYFGVERTSGRVPVVCDARDNATVSIDVPPLNVQGYFSLKVDLYRDNQVLGSTTQSFGLIDFDPGQWAPAEDSPFGICHLKDDRMYRLAQIAGMQWTRGGSNPSWPGVQPKQDNWNWASFDKSLATTEPFGIRKLIILSGIPKWASQGEDEFFIFFRRPANKRFFRLPQNLADFETYVCETVSRYKDRLKYWEIWNEADIGFWQGTDEEYIQLMQAAYRGAKRADPQCVVSMTGLAYTFPHTSRTGRLCDGRLFLEKCLKLAPNEFDIINFHSYGGLNPLERKLREINELKRQYECDKPVWITETGMPTHLRGATEQAQARYCAQAHATAFAAGVTKVFWHCFYDWGLDPNYNEHHFGLIHYDFSPKPAYMVYCAMTRELAGTKAVGKIDLGPGIRAVGFTKGDDPITMVWSEKDDRRILLKLDADHAEVTDLMGNPVSVKPAMRVVALDLTPDPVYVKGAHVLASLGNVVRLDETLALRPGESGNTTLSVENVFDTPVEGECAVSVPAGWQVRPDKVAFQLDPGKAHAVPLVLIAPPTLETGRAAVICDLRIGTLALPGLLAGSAMLALPIDAVPAETKLDADLSEWSADRALVVRSPDRLVNGECSGDTDLSARFWVASDRDGLVLAADVQDDWVGNYRRYNEPWNGDAIELFLDLRKGDQLGQAEYSDGVYQFFLIPPDDKTPYATWRLWQPKSAFAPVLDLVETRSDKGYRFEVKIPWRSFGPNAPLPGQAIGIDLCIDDADGTEPAKRQAQFAWAGTVRNHVDASGFARGLLQSDPVPVAISAGTGGNLAPNPSFETDLDEDVTIGIVDGWHGVTADWGDTTGSWDWDRKTGHDGSASVLLRDVTTHRAWESSDIPVLSDMTYTASAWIKTKDLGAGIARIYIACFDPAGKWVGSVAHSETVSGTSDWTRVQLQVPPGKCPAKATVMRFELSLRNAPHGTAWFDDLVLEAVRE